MQQVILIFYVLILFCLNALILLQHGKGADMGASFGSGASQTVFGSQGSGSFLLKVTGALGALFFISCLLLNHITAKQVQQSQFILPNSVSSVPMNPQSQSQQSGASSVPASMSTGSAPAKQSN